MPTGRVSLMVWVASSAPTVPRNAMSLKVASAPIASAKRLNCTTFPSGIARLNPPEKPQHSDWMVFITERMGLFPLVDDQFIITWGEEKKSGPAGACTSIRMGPTEKERVGPTIKDFFFLPPESDHQEKP